MLDKERQGLDPSLRSIVDEESEKETEKGRGFIYCAMCSSVIGKASDRIEVNGAHQHRCTNPYGYVFPVVCFSEALGCTLSGQRTSADTWFAGYQWRYASCSECQRHLGWYFDTADHYFYGLIMDRIQND